MPTDYHASNNYSYYYSDPRYPDAQNVADCLVKAFRDDPKFPELLEKNKLLKAWVASLDKKKAAAEKAKEARARAAAKAAEIAKKKEEALAKLSEEEKLVFGLVKDDSGKKSRKNARYANV